MSKLNKSLVFLFILIIFILLFTVKVKAFTSYDSATFGAEFYLGTNPDLATTFGNNYQSAYNHYISFGIREGRQTSICFDAKYYLNTNADLSKAFKNNYQAAHDHFITYGIKEGRQGSPYFNVIYYLNNNADLKKAFGSNYQLAYNHFITYGIKEGRRGSEFFDVKYYLNSNADLKKAFGSNYQLAYNHYILFGIKEGRNPSENINIRCYLNSYGDLKAAFKNDYKSAAEHYYIFGIKEHRNANHNYTAKKSTATCTKAGKTIYTCKCGATYEVDTPALGHNLSTKTINATCTENGKKVTSCSRCNYKTEETIPASGHKLENIPEVKATCTKAGSTAGMQCTVCHIKTVVPQVIQPLGHDYKENITQSATCTTPGKKTVTCSRCDYNVEETIKATGHISEIVPREEPTCTKTGLTQGTRCKVCKITLLPQFIIPVKDHTPNTPVVEQEATCAQEGLEVTYCSVCSQELSRKTIAKKDHTRGESVDATQPTCEEDGHSAGYKCSVCNQIIATKINKLGHNFSITVIPQKATCTKKGTTGGKQCSRCGYSTVEDTEPLGHDEQESIYRDATCTKTGLKLISCSRCSYTRYDEIPVKPHSLENITVKEATCTEPGYAGSGQYCTVCGYVTEGVTKTDAKGHQKGDSEPIRTTEYKHDVDGFQDGTKTYKCTTCQEEFTEVTQPVEHKTWRLIVSLKNHGTVGTLNICSICNKADFVQFNDTKNLNGHQLERVEAEKGSDGKDAHTAGIKCTQCNEEVYWTIHKYGEYRAVTDEDFTKYPDLPRSAKRLRECQNCNHIDYSSSAS